MKHTVISTIVSLTLICFVSCDWLFPILNESNLTTTKPSFSPKAGTLIGDQEIIISCSTLGSVIYYTTDGSIPTIESAQYTEAINISGNGTVVSIKAIAIASGYSPSSMVTATYTIAYPIVAMPIISPTGGSKIGDQEVMISCSTPGSVIYYTTDGSTPTTESPQYTEAITISGNGTIMTIKAIAIASGYSQSSIATANYSIVYPSVAIPIFSPSGGPKIGDQEIMISCSTPSSIIYFTTDGSTPTEESSQYTDTINLAGDGTVATINAIAFASGFSSSSVASTTYTIVYPSAISSNYYHSMLLMSDGTLWSTGSGTFGRQGNYNPTQVMADIKYISAGQEYAMIIHNDGSLWATGDNYFSQLGDGTTFSYSTPIKIMNNVATVSAVHNHTMILKLDGKLWSTRNYPSGWQGDPITLVDSDVVTFSANPQYTMFIKTDGTLWGAGFTNEGPLGDGTYTNTSIPVQVATDVISVFSKGMSTFFIKSDDSLWGMGYNGHGALGDGTGIFCPSPVKIMDGVSYVATGSLHNMILKKDGSLWGTGYNFSGQLGDGTNTNQNTPVYIMDEVAAVSTGSEEYTMILKNDGSLWATGHNLYGQLGDGNYLNRNVPVQVMDKVALVSSGGRYTMVIKTNGTIWATGFNMNGQLGDGTNINRFSFVKLNL